jgi:hypothetical protein
MFENIKKFFSNKTSSIPSANLIRVMEVADYDVDFQVVQHSDFTWSYYLEFYPMEGGERLIEENQFVDGVGVIDLVENVTGLLIPGKERYEQWEYAAETAIDIIELLGFDVYSGAHQFEIAFWDGIRNDREKKVGLFDGNDFFISPDQSALEGTN